MTNAAYGFMSWLRRGIATGLTTPDAASLGQPRVSLPLQVSVSGGTGGTVAVNGLYLYGPGEITRLDSSTIAKEWPLPGTLDAESNYCPTIELVPADLPWTYTPAAPETTHDRLRPWLCLLALEDSEGTVVQQSDGSQIVTVGADTPLPKLSQAWAWAHVQVAGTKSLDPSKAADIATLRDALANHPGQLVARLICPRRLSPSTHYTMCLVPVFARGAQAGLGAPPANTVDGLAPSWSDQDAPARAGELQLPVYHAWEFSTSDFGDFEYLVRQLKPTDALPSTVGVRPMDVGHPGSMLPSASPATGDNLSLEGALKAPGSGTAWKSSDRKTWTTALVNLIAAASPAQSALPLYGRWHAARNALDPNVDLSKPLPWFDDLNTDPRLRVAASLGVAVVQSEQQQLMASAWEQGAGIVEINAELRHAQLGREVTTRLYRRHILPMSPATALQISGPVQSRTAYATVDCETNQFVTRSISAWLAASPAPRGFFDPQFRRVSRAWGGALATLGPPAATDANPRESVLDRLMNRTLVAAPAPPAPSGVVTMAAAGFDPARLSPMLTSNGPSTAAPANYYPIGGRDVVPPSPPAASDNLGTQWAPFGKAIRDLVAALAAPPRPAVVTCPLAPGTLSAVVTKAIDPAATHPTAYTGRLTTAPVGSWRGTDPLGPVYFAPTYPQPTFDPLIKLSKDWIIPGLDQVPPNTICLLETNERFIEAYMAGLNFELGRELVWNGIPTDQRGSYFRQFWDHSTALTASLQPVADDARYDIDVLTNWKQHPLGQNPNPNGLPAGALFLLLRGDLLHRYPNALFYATKATMNGAKRAFPDPDASPAPQEKYPLFSASIPRDISFFAFDLPYDEAYGETSDPTKPGWYFVLQEHAVEPRFGFEAAESTDYGKAITDWTHVNWGSFASDEAALEKIAYIDLDASLPGITGSSDIAYAMLRDPVRVAIHASQLLPVGGP
jgi:hypothetical protein